MKATRPKSHSMRPPGKCCPGTASDSPPTSEDAVNHTIPLTSTPGKYSPFAESAAHPDNGAASATLATIATPATTWLQLARWQSPKAFASSDDAAVWASKLVVVAIARDLEMALARTADDGQQVMLKASVSGFRWAELREGQQLLAVLQGTRKPKVLYCEAS